MGGSKSKPATQTSNPSTVYAAQDPYLKDMYSQAQNVYQQQMGDSAEMANAKALMAQMGGQYGQANAALGQGGKYMDQGYQAMLAANPNFASAEQNFGNASQGYNSFMNPGVNPMSDMYARQTGQQFREQIMPQLQGQQMMAGGFGGSRGQIGEALAAARSSQQLQDWNAQLYNDDMNRKLQASQGLAGVGQGYTTLGSARTGQGTAMGNLGAQQGAIAQGYQRNAEGMGGLAEMGMNLPWYALEKYKGLLGQPTVLGGGGSSTGGTAGSSGGWGTAISAAGLIAAPFTGGASLALAAGANAAVNQYYK
jgi:hypothetical protein